MALIPACVDSVEAPVIAAGGIADARGVRAALTLGAEAVQIGTAFLATDESAAAPAHKELLLDGRGGHTRLTRAFTGRLARGIVNQAMDELGADVLPFPYQAYLVRPLTVAAREQGRTDISALWAGQAANLVRHRRAERTLLDRPLSAPVRDVDRADRRLVGQLGQQLVDDLVDVVLVVAEVVAHRAQRGVHDLQLRRREVEREGDLVGSDEVRICGSPYAGSYIAPRLTSIGNERRGDVPCKGRSGRDAEGRRHHGRRQCRAGEDRRGRWCGRGDGARACSLRHPP